MARAVALDIFGISAVTLEDLQPGLAPQLVEIEWSGEVVDMVTPEGIEAAGFEANYPQGVDHSQTQPAATQWHAAGAEGVCCRSASVHRLGRSRWEGEHREFGELAIYPDHADRAATLLARRDDLDWLRGPSESIAE